MADVIKFEKLPTGGGVAYMQGRRDGYVLMWRGPGGSSVLAGFNRPGGALSPITRPERFGPTPHTWAAFQKYARVFAAAGEGRSKSDLAYCVYGDGELATHVVTTYAGSTHRVIQQAGMCKKHAAQHVFGGNDEHRYHRSRTLAVPGVWPKFAGSSRRKRRTPAGRPAQRAARRAPRRR